MNMHKILLLFFVGISFQLHAQPHLTEFERSKGTASPAYHEIIDWWQKLDRDFAEVTMKSMGPSDAGFPLHLITVSTDKDFNFESLRRKNKRIILINNGIHPGEPDGIDASMLLVRDIVTKKYKLPSNVVLAIIPVYNIGGCLNRSPYYRVDQDGPVEKGFRGNSQNLDLNRDFIKSDSKEARSFAEIFHLTEPDVFVDNHVSNGADYQHIMTLLVSQHNKLGGPMGEYMNRIFEPALYPLMKAKGFDMVQYVHHYGDSVENGWAQYWDSPRYSSGYATLWHSFAFVPETHMLKPYDQRVKSTYALMQSFIEFTSANSEAIKKARDDQKLMSKTATNFPISWAHDRTKFTEINFKGYESGRKPSAVSNLPRLYYDRNKPYERKVKFYNQYNPKTIVTKPSAYIIPQGWWQVIDLLKTNKVRMRQFSKDTAIEVEIYRIEDYRSSARPYESHHLNSDVKLSSIIRSIQFRKGDYFIPFDQPASRFLIETLEPQAEDSYFSWNFFDGILGQKEGISEYVFEDRAAEFLKKNPDIQLKLNSRIGSDTAFAKSARAQLNFIYQNSPYFEPDFLKYPVYRVIK